MRYILDDLGFIEEISFGATISCNDKSCTEYTGEVPDGYDSLCEWVDNANIRAYKIENGSLVFDEDRADDLEKERVVYKDPKIIYETTLTKAGDTIEATGLDMVRDGGEYEFDLIHAEETLGDLAITFNDITTGYYQQGLYHSGNLTADGSLTTVSFYRKNKTRIYYGTGGTTDMSFPATTRGRFFFSNISAKKVSYELKNMACINGSQAISDLCGVNDQSVDNLTSIKISKETGSNFLVGTRLIIRRK